MSHIGGHGLLGSRSLNCGVGAKQTYGYLFRLKIQYEATLTMIVLNCIVNRAHEEPSGLRFLYIKKEKKRRKK